MRLVVPSARKAKEVFKMQEPVLEYSIHAKPPEGCGFIYQLESPSGKRYIGQTVHAVSRRLVQHASNKGCPALSAAIAKYGIKNFKVSVLMCVPIADLDREEENAIATIHTLYPIGYNIRKTCREGPGRDSSVPYRHSEESKRKISSAYYERMLFGEPFKSDFESRSRASKGRKYSDETKRKVSEGIRRSYDRRRQEKAKAEHDARFLWNPVFGFHKPNNEARHTP